MALEKRQLVMLVIAGALGIAVAVRYWPSSAPALPDVKSDAQTDKLADDIRTLAQSTDAEAPRRLLQLTQDPRPQVQAAAVRALGTTRAVLPPEVSQQVAVMITDPTRDEAVRTAAVSYAGTRNARELLPSLLEVLDDGSDTIRAEANATIVQLFGRNYRFNPYAPPAERAKIIARMRADLGTLSGTPPRR